MPPAAAATALRDRPSRKRAAARAKTATAPGRRAGTTRKGLVRRASLVRRLASARDATLAVIVAPPGYGKSSLLAEWAEHDEREFVWLTPAMLEPDELEAIDGSILDAADDERGVVLVLDDAHLAPPELVRHVLGQLLEELPAGSMVAIASRTEPPLPLGRLRARRALIEVRVQDLAMMPAEASILLREAGPRARLRRGAGARQQNRGVAGRPVPGRAVGPRGGRCGRRAQPAARRRSSARGVLPRRGPVGAVARPARVRGPDVRARGAVGAAVRRGARPPRVRAHAHPARTGDPAAASARPRARAVSVARAVPRRARRGAPPHRSRARAGAPRSGELRGARRTEMPTGRSPMPCARTIPCGRETCCGRASSRT